MDATFSWQERSSINPTTVQLNKPVVLGSSFGGFVALTYAALFPDHPGAVILANTTGGHRDQQRVIEAFRRVGGDEAAAAIQRSFTEDTEEADAEFKRTWGLAFPGTPVIASRGWPPYGHTRPVFRKSGPSVAPAGGAEHASAVRERQGTASPLG